MQSRWDLAGCKWVKLERVVGLVSASPRSYVSTGRNEKTDSHRIDAKAWPLFTCKLACLIAACQHACFGGETLSLVFKNKG